MTALELHPLSALFPRLDGDEYERLKTDIAARGLREPITIHDGMVLDGGNRYRACAELGIQPRTIDFEGDDPAALVAYVLSANLHRRHLTPGQQAAIVAAAQDWTKASGHGGDRRSDQAATLSLETIAGRAAVSGSSERTQRMADKVAREAPGLAKQVAHGDISLPRAVQQISGRKPIRAAAPIGCHSCTQLRTELEAATARILQLEAQLAQAVSGGIACGISGRAGATVGRAA